MYKNLCIVRTYHKCSWIIRYIGVYLKNRIVLLNCMYRMIHRHMGLKRVFFFFGLKFMVLFDLNKLLNFFNTKLLGYLIESNKITCPWVFFPLFSFSNKIWTTHLTLRFYICKFIFYTMCKDQIWLESKTGMDPGSRSPNNKFIECRKES